MESTTRRYLTVKELQNIIGCSSNKAYKIIKIKGFPKIRIGKNYYIDKDLLEKWLRENLYTAIQT